MLGCLKKTFLGEKLFNRELKGGQVLIFENSGTIVRNRSDLDRWILQFWKRLKGREFSFKKKLFLANQDEKKSEKKERFPEGSLFKYR